MASCICAARCRAASNEEMRCARLIPLGGAAHTEEYHSARRFSQRGLQTQAAEDGERVPGLGLQDDLSAGLDLAVEAGRKRVRVLAGGSADDEVVEAPLGLVALGLESAGKLVGLFARRTLDAHLPRCIAALELLLFPRLARRLIVPAVLLVEPVLDLTRPRFDAVRAKLRLHDCVRALCFGASPGVDEHCGAVARDDEPSGLELVRELPRLLVEVTAEPVEQPRGVFLFLDVDPDAPVVVGHASSLVCARGLARAVRARRGALRGRGDAGARRAPAGAARELGVGGRALAAHGGRSRGGGGLAPAVG